MFLYSLHVFFIFVEVFKPYLQTKQLKKSLVYKKWSQVQNVETFNITLSC